MEHLSIQYSDQLAGAVSTSRALTSKGLLQRLFAFWFDAFVYNQIWEDPRVDLEALELDARSRVLTISSGGCNVLNYLIEGPESVTAVDLNRYHIYLLELKIAALRSLPTHEDFFAFFGEGKHPNNLRNYERYIAPLLNGNARKFWEEGRIFGGTRIEYFSYRGLYEHSRNGYFLRFFHRFAHLIGLRPEAILKAKSLDEQRNLFDENIAPFFESKVTRLLGRLPVTTFGLGIPPQQLEELKRDIGDASLIDIYRERTRKLACGFPINDNYFAWQALSRRYDVEDRKAIPDYLREENFDLLKAQANNVTSRVNSVTSQIQSSERCSYNRFVFLDAQDWMDAGTLRALWQRIADRAEPGSRIIFRTAAVESPLRRVLPSELIGRFTYEEEVSRELFEKDRASIYGGFHLYIFEG